MPTALKLDSDGRMQMAKLDKKFGKASVAAVLLARLAFGATGALAQQAGPRDPAEPAQGRPQPKILARPAGRVLRASVDEKSMKALIGKLVACGTRLTLSPWTDPKRQIRIDFGANLVEAHSAGKCLRDSSGKRSDPGKNDFHRFRTL
jgi:hypothetical protein